MASFKKILRNILGLRTVPPDFVGYENLIAFMESRQLHRLDGDIIEIGAFMGGGTVRLARYARKYEKAVYVIDIFDPGLDQTASRGGMTACEVYEAYLEGNQMLAVYQEATRGFDNVVTIIEDSMKVRFPEEQKFVFGFVDGCHEKAHVENDFHIIWPHLVSGGVIGCHDYKYEDWWEVTEAIEELIEQHRDEIEEMHEIEGSYGITSILMVKK